MQHLELTLPRSTFLKAARMSFDLAPDQTRPKSCFPQNVMVFFSKLAVVVGKENILQAVRAVEAGGWLAQGLGTMGGNDQFCANCGYFRVTRTICMQCGSLATDERGNDLYSGLNEEELKSLKSHPRPDAETVFAAILRGLKYFEQVLMEEKSFSEFNGDMIFLNQKLINICKGHPTLEPACRSLFERMADRFCARHIHLNSDALEEGHYILDLVEGLHALQKTQYFPKVTASCVVVVSSTTVSAVGAAGDLATASCKTTATSNKEILPEEPLRFTRGGTAKAMRITTDEVFDFDVISREVITAMKSYDLTEILGFDPTSGQIPQTPLLHCSHCGLENKRGSSVCSGCNCQLRCQVDYGALTDASVWSYVFGAARFPLECRMGNYSADLSVQDVFRLLSEARCYRDLDELGSDGWKLQSYFASHFIYIMSDWGSYRLRREIYLEEFRYFAENLRRAIRMKDPELLGEFLHCLRVLGLDPGNPQGEDPLLVEAYWDGVACLVENEKAGMWTSSTSAPYARYHSAWCGIVGLLSTVFDNVPMSFVGNLDLPKPEF